MWWWSECEFSAIVTKNFLFVGQVEKPRVIPVNIFETIHEERYEMRHL